MYSLVPTPLSPDAFHARIYAGEILHFNALAAMQTLVALTQDMLESAFHPFSPVEIHRHLDPERRITSFAARQREFSQSGEIKRRWREVFEEIGLDPSGVARDQLYLRFQPDESGGQAASRARTTATIAFHRDTWGSNLYAQTNWWAPVYPITAGRTVAMYPALWSRAVRNTSAEFDLAAILARSAVQGRNAVDVDEAIPHLAEEVSAELAIPVVVAPGTTIAFSGAHAHAGVPNRTGSTRISLETRTVWIDDVRSGRGAPNVDGKASWMSPGLFRRLSDGAPLNEVLQMGRLEPYLP
jgi:hypothetical protein